MEIVITLTKIMVYLHIHTYILLLMLQELLLQLYRIIVKVLDLQIIPHIAVLLDGQILALPLVMFQDYIILTNII